jgi:hypothetical protein
MEKILLIIGSVVVLIGIISWFKSRSENDSDLIFQQDIVAIKGCIQMAFEVLGRALNSDHLKTPAEAIEVGKTATANNGISCAIVANVLAQGLLGGYAAKHQFDNQKIQALMLHCSNLLANGYGLNVEELWDRTGELIKIPGPLGFLMQQGMQEGVELPEKVKSSPVLAGLVLEAVSQARG